LCERRADSFIVSGPFPHTQPLKVSATTVQEAEQEYIMHKLHKQVRLLGHSGTARPGLGRKRWVLCVLCGAANHGWVSDHCAPCTVSIAVPINDGS
jgi:hypothetical protein